MNESKEFGILVVGSAEGGAYFKPDGRNVSEPRGHLRFIDKVIIFTAILLAAGSLILTENPVSTRMEAQLNSLARTFEHQDNVDYQVTSNPAYRENFAATR